MMNRQGKTWDAVEEKCSRQTKPFGKTSRYTTIKTSRGQSNAKDWWIMCTPFSFSEVKLGRDETFLPEKTKRDVGLLPDKNTHYGHKNNLGEDEIFFPVRTSIGKYVARHGGPAMKKGMR